MPDRSPADICGWSSEYIFGRKALKAIPGFRAAVHEERHVKNTFPLHVTKWIDLDQSPKPLQNSKSGQRDGKGPEPQKRDPDRNRGLPLLLATWLCTLILR